MTSSRTPDSFKTRTRIGIFVLVVLALAIFSVKDAMAQDPTDSTPATAGLLWRAAAQADHFWTAKGMPSTCGPTAVLMTSELASTTDGGARANDCRIWVSRVFWARTSKSLHDNRGREFFRARRIRTQEVCALMVHEMGHVRGLDHTAGGIMDGEDYNRAVPGACIDFAAKEHPKPKVRTRTRR